MNTKQVVLISLLALTSYAVQPCSALQLDIVPESYTEESTGPANFTCSLGSADSKDVDIYLLEILRNGEQPIVFLRNSGIHFGNEYKDSSKFQAKGVISGSVANSYLQLSIYNPDQTDSGIYTCKMFVSDLSGNLLERRSNTNFTVDRINLNDVVRQLLAKVSILEAKLEAQTDKGQSVSDRVDQLTSHVDDATSRLENVTQIHSDVITDLGLKGRSESERLDQLTSTTQRQGNEIADLDDTTTRLANMTAMQSVLIADLGVKVSFTASLSSHTTVPVGKDVVFDKVIMRQGDGYDPITGIFTVPVSGTYSFVLVMMAWPETSDRNGEVNLLVDGNRVATLLARVPTSVNYLQTSTSTVAWLTVGQQVKAQGADEMRWHPYPYSVFTGFLVSPE